MHLAALEAHLRLRAGCRSTSRSSSKAKKRSVRPASRRFWRAIASGWPATSSVISDTAVFAEDVPSLTVSLRGLVHWEVTVHGPANDLHSGYFGGLVINPLEALAQVIAGATTPKDGSRSPGFYDGVLEPERGRTRGLGGPAVRRGERGRGLRRARPERRTGSHPARTDVVAPDPRVQRHLRRLSRPGRQDDRSELRAREALGAACCRPRARRVKRAVANIFSASRRTACASRSKRRRRARRRDLARPSRGRGRGARDGTRLRQAAGLHRHRRHDRPGLVLRPHPAVCRKYSSASVCPTTRSTRPTNSSTWPIFRRHRNDDVPVRRTRRGGAVMADRELTPREIVIELDRYIVGQSEAKRAVAIAMRNRYRRERLPTTCAPKSFPRTSS